MLTPLLQVDRYSVFRAIGAGGMAQVHLGQLKGPVGFSRVVAIKRMHPHLAADPDFVERFVDEARLASRVRHPNVAPVLDVLATGGELLLVLDYIPGESVNQLIKRASLAGSQVPVNVAVRVVADALRGLHAAHEAKSERNRPLGIVHRDVSPHNLLLGADGHTRVLDFGVAQAAFKLHQTRTGEVQGKLAYMSPEQIHGQAVDRRADVYSASITLWELLTLRKPVEAHSEAELVQRLSRGDIPAPETVRTDLPAALSALVMRGLAQDPAARFPTALAMAEALEACVTPATPGQAGRWLEQIAGDALEARAAEVAEIEQGTAPPSSHGRRLDPNQTQPPAGLGVGETPVTEPGQAQFPTVTEQSTSSSSPDPALARPLAGGTSTFRGVTTRGTSRERSRWPLIAVAALAAIGGVASWAAGRGAPEARPAEAVASERAPSAAEAESSAESAIAAPVPVSSPSTSAPAPSAVKPAAAPTQAEPKGAAQQKLADQPGPALAPPSTGKLPDPAPPKTQPAVPDDLLGQH